MAHMIESMMYAGDRPWHGLGTGVEKEQTSEDAIRLAGLDWRVNTQPVYANIAPESGLGAENLRLATEFKACVRNTDNRVLGIVGSRYVPIQNEDAFSFFDGVVGDKLAMYHTAGSLDGGKRVWILAKLPGDLVIPGKKNEQVEKFLLLSNSHDGSGALRMFFTPVRVVCQNTLSMALSGFNGVDGISIRHTANATQRIQEAQRALGLAVEYYEGFQKKMISLVQAKYSEKQMVSLVETLFPAKDESEVATRTANNRSAVMHLFENGKGHEGIRGTAWAAYNAVAEFTDHHRSTRTTDAVSKEEARLASVWFGSARQMKQKAFNVIANDIQLAA